MSNRNILNQNINGRNILNIKNKNLLDGNAINISSRNEIDLNMKTNTTEQTTIGNEDLFLLSDTTGKNIKYIKGLNLKQQGLTHIEGGTNINTSINSINGDTIINLDNEIELQRVSIKKNPISTAYPINYAFIVGSTNKFTLIAQGSPASGGESSPPYQINLLEITASTEYPFLENTYSFRSGLINGVLKINNKVADAITVNNTNPQFLIKDTNKSFSSGNFLGVDSSYKITPINILVGNNITKATNSTTNDITLNLNAILTLLTSINGYGFNTSTTATVNQFLLKDTSVGSFSNGDLLNINSSGKVDNITPTQLLNNLTVSNGLIKSTNAISISTSPTINIINAGMTLKNLSGTNGGNALLKIQAGTSASFSPQIELIQDGEIRTYLQYDKSNNKFYILAPTGVIELIAYGGTGRININNQNVEIKIDNNIIVKVQSTQVDINKNLFMNGNLISFQSNNTSHFIQYSNTDMNGVEIAGFGSSVVGSPLFRVKSSSGSDPIVLECERDRIEVKKPIYMNGNLINFQTTNTNRLNFIQFKEADGMNGILVKGFGINSSTPSVRRALFRVETSDTGVSQPILLDVFPERVDVFKKLSVIKDTSTLQNDPNDIFTVRNAGFVKAILHSDSNNCELAFKTGTHQALLKYFTSKFFQVITPDGGEFSINIGAHKQMYFKKESTNYTSVLSSGSGSNGNCILYLTADTDNTVESANPHIDIQQDGALVRFIIGIRDAQNRSYINAALNTDLSIQQSGTDRIKVHSSGVTVYGTFTNNSDDRIKFGETSLNNALTTIKKLNPVSYRMTYGLNIPDSPDLPIQWGFVAQELYNTVPEMKFAVAFNKTMERNFVDGDLDGDCVEDIYDEYTTSQGVLKQYPEICSIDYNSFTTLNVKAIQELLLRVETLEEQLVTQSNLISNLQSQINNNI